MKTVVAITALGLVLTQSLALGAAAQPADTVRAERKQEARAAAQAPLVGEGNPLPTPRARPSTEAKAEGRAARRQTGRVAAKEARVGEGDPLPEARAKVPRTERAAARTARSKEVARGVKSGEIKSIGEGGD